MSDPLKNSCVRLMRLSLRLGLRMEFWPFASKGWITSDANIPTYIERERGGEKERERERERERETVSSSISNFNRTSLAVFYKFFTISYPNNLRSSCNAFSRI